MGDPIAWVVLTEFGGHERRQYGPSGAAELPRIARCSGGNVEGIPAVPTDWYERNGCPPVRRPRLSARAIWSTPQPDVVLPPQAATVLPGSLPSVSVTDPTSGLSRHFVDFRADLALPSQIGDRSGRWIAFEYVKTVGSRSRPSASTAPASSRWTWSRGELNETAAAQAFRNNTSQRCDGSIDP